MGGRMGKTSFSEKVVWVCLESALFHSLALSIY